jgi:TatD DNase family protein
MKFDVHTHHIADLSGNDSVLNVLWNESVKSTENQLFSLSVHPWFLDKFSKDDFVKILDKYVDNQNFVAIGECGLDKNTAFSLEFQISVLNQIYQLAEFYKKPLIIHCVGYFNELINWKKDKNAVPMLIHGFVKKIELLESLIKSGFYISFGSALCLDKPTLKNAFRHMPFNKMFLETDDQTVHNIGEIYDAASKLRKISMDEMESVIDSNRICFFNFNK